MEDNNYLIKEYTLDLPKKERYIRCSPQHSLGAERRLTKLVKTSEL